MLHALIATAGASWAWASVSCFAAAILSAIFPWIAAEAVLIAFLALAHSPAQVAGVVVILSVGQMAGKAIVFWGARRGRWGQGHSSGLAARWKERMTSRPQQASSIVLLSSIVGFPPFFLITFAAGAFGVSFQRFMVAGTTGRLVRFGALAFLPHAIVHIWR